MIRVLGVMTGTSCDGLDASCLELSEGSWRALWNRSIPYPSALQKKVLHFQKPGNRHSVESILTLDRDLGLWYGQALSKLTENQSEKPDVIANHGQTVAHFPKKGGKTLTLQLGDPARICARTGLTVVSHFRNGDIASGGQGAPLVPRFHLDLSRRLEEASSGVAIHNIGGVSNLSYFSPSGEIIAFDTGPGGIWIDHAAREATRGKLKMDLDGKMAARGEADSKAVAKFLAHPYFRKGPPKSTGRDQFPYSAFKKLTRAKGPSLVATATELTVQSIATSYEKWIINAGYPLHAVYLCGGGARNPSILGRLKQRMPQVKWKTLADAGLDNHLIEAQAFAYFGYRALKGQAIGGEWTGADPKVFGPPAQITPGPNWTDVLSKIAELT